MTTTIDGGTLIEEEDPLIRDLSDTDPINITWDSADPDSITAEVSFDGNVYVPTVGTVAAIDVAVWQLEYHAQDRPTNPSTVTYRFTDNNGNVQSVSITFTGTVSTPELPELTHSAYGPKRIKTKQMEIEAHDPEKLQRLTERETAGTPTFCGSKACVGVPLPPHLQAHYRDFRDNRHG